MVRKCRVWLDVAIVTMLVFAAHCFTDPVLNQREIGECEIDEQIDEIVEALYEDWIYRKLDNFMPALEELALLFEGNDPEEMMQRFQKRIQVHNKSLNGKSHPKYGPNSKGKVEV